MGKRKEILGQKFGKLLVTGLAYKDSAGTWEWYCKCDCGNECVVKGTNLRRGNTQSCGCYQRERTGESHLTHGLSNTLIDYVHRNMKNRCYREKDERYKDYGGRGIKVCDRWRGPEGLQNFIEDMGERPEGTQIDRVDNDGDYTPENCRWATVTENARHKRNTNYVTYKGETRNLSEWAEITGIPYKTLWARLFAQGWSVEDALTIGVEDSANYITYKGETKRITHWAEKLSVSYVALYARIMTYGWDVEKAFTTPFKEYDEKGVTYKGETKSYQEWAKELGIDRGVLYDRIAVCGWSVERAFTTLVRPRDRGKFLITFRGKTQTIIEWSEETNISVRAIKDRLYKRGWSIERTLTEPMQHSQ
jgi:hypothetical protein